jgi:hypothetical protein
MSALRAPRALAAAVLFAAAGLAHGAPTSACSDGNCSASGVAPGLLREAARASVVTTGRLDGPLHGKLEPRPADTWEHALGVRPGQEAYDCALSFGIGGALGKDGFLGTRVLGRTQVWRDSPAAAQSRPVN